MLDAMNRTSLVFALLLSSCGSDSDLDTGIDLTPTDVANDVADEEDGADGITDDTEADTTLEPPDWPVDLRPLSASELRIVDDYGRDVLLRGVNVTSLGEYWRGDPAQAPTVETTAEDWSQMAAAGVSVIRLIVHWSLIEPVRGEIDQTYLDEVDEYVAAAAAHGIYTVIDMHQDAYSAFIFTGPDEECPEGTRPGKGWDGAPEWATITDGASTCTPGERNAAPAVLAAWSHFYRNTDGIRDRFVASWAAVAERFAGRPEVAGYDVLNEPEAALPSAENTPLYDELLRDVVAAIREAETGADFDHLIFVEPAFGTANPDYGFIIPNPNRAGFDSTNIVSAPHNYAESIDFGVVSLTIEGMNDLYLAAAEGIGVPTWLGEYGFWDASESTTEKLARFAADEDANRIGGTWWQWRQPCGDPHSVDLGDDYVNLHLNGLQCPGDIELGPTEPFFRVLSRGYPRAAPGALQRLESDPASGALTIEGNGGEAGSELLVWTPVVVDQREVEVENLGEVRWEQVGDGYRGRAEVLSAGDYAFSIAAE